MKYNTIRQIKKRLTSDTVNKWRQGHTKGNLLEGGKYVWRGKQEIFYCRSCLNSVGVSFHSDETKGSRKPYRFLYYRSTFFVNKKNIFWCIKQTANDIHYQLDIVSIFKTVMAYQVNHKFYWKLFEQKSEIEIMY